MFPLYDDNPSRTKPIITWTLIVINVIVFLYEITSGRFEQLVIRYGVVPLRILHGKALYTLFTSMFLHADFLHLLGNMVYLFIFGDNVEDNFGHLKFLFLYILFGLAGAFLHIFMALNSGNPVELKIPAIGASGAISGVLGAYVVFFPRARVITAVLYFYLIQLVAIPALYFIGFWFILQLIYASLGSITGIAAWAHVGGFIAGALIALIYKPYVKEWKIEEFEEWEYYY